MGGDGLPGVVTILGIDPGTAITGYGVIRADEGHCVCVACGAIRTRSDQSRSYRLHLIHLELQRILAEHTPDMMAVEQLFFSRNVQTAMAVGEARGVALLSAAEFGIPVHEYTPTQVKLSLTGSGRADKAEMQQMVAWTLDLPEPPRPDDVADALAIALCHLYQARLEGMEIPTAGSRGTP